MAFDISGLAAYVDNNSKEIALKAVSKAKTASLLISNRVAQFGVKGTAAVLSMDADVVFQDGSSCGRTPSGSVTLNDINLVVKPIKDIQNICTKDLWNTAFSAMLAKGQAPEESFTPEFASEIMDYRAAKLASQVEKLLWQGNTALTGTTNMKRIDGFVKQIGSGAALTSTGATIVEKLQAAFLSANVDERSQDDYRFFLGEDIYAEYLVALAAKNIFKPTDDNTVFGTTAKFEVVPGLNGIRKVYGMRYSNTRLGMDGEGDADSARMFYDVASDVWFQDFKFAVGVVVIDPTLVGVATV